MHLCVDLFPSVDTYLSLIQKAMFSTWDPSKGAKAQIFPIEVHLCPRNYQLWIKHKKKMTSGMCSRASSFLIITWATRLEYLSLASLSASLVDLVAAILHHELIW